MLNEVLVLTLRAVCKLCGGTSGRVLPRNGQDCVFCTGCQAFQYNAPKSETGRATRSLQTTHDAIKPAQRARVLLRANGRCELCGTVPNGSDRGLHVGHLLSVEDGHGQGLPDSEINSDENLSAMCDECNIGLRELSVPPRLLVALIRARTQKGRTREADASGWLIERFVEKREWSSGELSRAAKESGVNRDAIFEARARLDLPRSKKHIAENGDIAWIWWVPEDWVHFPSVRYTAEDNQ